MLKSTVCHLFRFLLLSQLVTQVSCDDFSSVSVQNTSEQSAMELMNNGDRLEGDSELDEDITDMTIDDVFNDQGILDQSVQASDLGADELDMGGTLDLDADIVQDQEIACLEGDERHAGDCGWLICQQGRWVDRAHAEVCNAYDDDCDGRSDETSRSTGLQSECSDEQMMYTRSVCETGSCVSLPIGSCRLDGDCDDNQLCVSQNCEEPRPLLSCTSDHIIALGQSISLMSANSSAWSSEGCSGTAGDATVVTETELAPELVVTVDTTSLVANTRVNITAQAACNGRSIRSVVALMENCHAIPNACAYDGRGVVQEPDGIFYTSRLTTTLTPFVHTTLIIHLLNADLTMCSDLENLSFRVSISDPTP